MKRLQRFEVWAESVMRKQASGMRASCFRGAATPFSWIYGALVKSRNAFYDKRGGATMPIPVISVGNVVCGGTGKTDIVTLLAQALSVRVGILSRGVGGAVKKPFCVYAHPAQECGDEPRMLANRLPNVLVVVGKDRIEGARLAIELGAQVLILDDGMQHRRLARDIEIAVVDGDDPFGGNYLPKGILRDDPQRLNQADLVIVSGKRVKLPISTPVVHVTSEIEGIFTLDGKRIETLRGVAVALFCGIGNPLRFLKTMQDMGADVRRHIFVPDHQTIEEKQLEDLFESSRARYLVCTEKDRVKLTRSQLPIVWVKRRLLVDENVKAWHTLLQEIGKKL